MSMLFLLLLFAAVTGLDYLLLGFLRLISSVGGRFVCQTLLHNVTECEMLLKS